MCPNCRPRPVLAQLARTTPGLCGLRFCGRRWNLAFALGLLSVFANVAFADDRSVAAPPAGDSAKVWRRHTIDDSSRGADGARLRDVNGDGLSDVVTGWEEGGVVRLYLHPGYKRARHLWPSVTVGKVKSAEDAVLADLDRDGAFDVISSCEGKTKTIFFHWAPSKQADVAESAAERILDPMSWTTNAVTVTKDSQSWMFAIPMDIDGQYGIDLVVGSKGNHAAIGWLESPPNARDVDAWKYHRLRDAGWIMSLETFDVDRDGDLDVVFSDRKGSRSGVFWLSNPGKDRVDSPWREFPIGALGREVMFLDVQRDRQGLPLVAVAVKPASILLHSLRNDAVPSAWDVREYVLPPAKIGNAKSVRITDVDTYRFVFSCEHADGDRSGVVSVEPLNADSQNLSVNDVSGAEGIKFDLLQLIDVDGDGDQDIMTCEERSNLGLVWYENPGR